MAPNIIVRGAPVSHEQFGGAPRGKEETVFSTTTRQPTWLRLAALASAVSASLLAIPATAGAAPQWRIVDLGLSSYSQAYAINAKGHIVGHENGRAFLWRDGRVTYLTPPGVSSVATDINDHDEVVGYTPFSSMAVGFLWRDGVLTNLGTPPQYRRGHQQPRSDSRPEPRAGG